MSTRKEVQYVAADHCYVFECPHCELPVQVAENEINCQIFVHGIMKNTGSQVNPHATKEHCDRLIEQDLVHGCCKPFKIFRGMSGAVEYANIYNNG
jgi:hypothetical protein